MIRQPAPLQVAMVAYSCVVASPVQASRLQVARIAQWRGQIVRVHLISPWRAPTRRPPPTCWRPRSLDDGLRVDEPVCGPTTLAREREAAAQGSRLDAPADRTANQT